MSQCRQTALPHPHPATHPSLTHLRRLSASSDAYGVALGGFLGHLGHSLCTGAAVIGGRHLSQYINERYLQVRALI